MQKPVILWQLWQRMGLLFMAFFVLVLASVGATSWTLNAEQQDALAINLAGRQRMLIQQMTKDTLQLSHQLDENATLPDELERRRASLQETIATFEETLSAFINGGEAPYLPGSTVQLTKITSPEIVAGLNTVQQSWDSFRRQMAVVQSPESGNEVRDAAASRVEQLSPALVQQADEVVRLFEDASNLKVARVRQIQLLFFGAALILLLFGGWVTFHEIISPLNQLEKAATRIGAGDLDSSVNVPGPHEIQVLAESFESMRREIKRAQDNLEVRVARRTRELGAAFELSQEIVTELTLEKTLSLVANRAKSLANADTAVLCLLSPSGKMLNMAAFSSETPLESDADSQLANRGVAVKVLKNAEPVTVDVMCADCQFLNHQSGICTATPLRAGEKTLGALCVVRPESRQFDADEVRALSLLANSAAIAINNARLIQTEHEQTKQTARLTERNRLAAELHDNLAQTLSFLNLKSDQLSDLIVDNNPETAGLELLQMKKAIQTAYQQVRGALVELQEPLSPPGDFTDELAANLQTFETETHITTELNISPRVPDKIARATHTQALHVLREALVNVRRHAGAQHVAVELSRDNGTLCLAITDDGQGFNLDEAKGSNHLGLKIMRARVERSGGSIQIVSAPHKGTQIIAKFPANNITARGE